MGVGQGSLIGNLSYHAFGRELSYGSYNTCTAGLNVLSSSMKVAQETKVLEEIQTSRTNSNALALSKMVEGDMEFYFSPRALAANYLLQNAFGGGPVTSATATGETAGGAGFTHTVNIQNFDQTYSSLCLNVRKGDSTSGKVFQYDGIRVNEFTFSAEIDEALKCTASLIGRDATVGGTDVAGVLSTGAQQPLSFVNGRFSVEGSVGSLTSTSYWNVQNIEFKISNNLMSDSGSRRIGTNVLQVLPAGMAVFELKVTVRFDTTTAYDAMLAQTQFAAEFEFLGATMATSKIREGIKIVLPAVKILDSGDPEIGGPNELLTSEITFVVLRDLNAGYACRALVTNDTASYA